MRLAVALLALALLAAPLAAKAQPAGKIPRVKVRAGDQSEDREGLTIPLSVLARADEVIE